jgi:predicted RNase H-related nuclease YkuK (DUF458 family)
MLNNNIKFHTFKSKSNNSKNTYLSELQFLEKLKYYNKNGYNLFIGTDSKIIKNKVLFITAICFHKQNFSGQIFIIKENTKKCLSLKERMTMEAYKSIEIGLCLQEFYSGNIELHLDIGSTSKSKTSLYENELKKMVISQGFECKIKPYSWASSAVADHYLNKKIIK